MATYTHLEIPVPSGVHWYDVTINGDTPVSATNTLLVLPNSDGTQTRIAGTGFAFDPITGAATGGTVDFISRTNAAGSIIYEQVTGLNLSLAVLANAGDGNGPAFALIFAGVDTFNGWSGNDLFVGGAGGDSFIGGAGTDFVSYDNSPVGLIADLGNSTNNNNFALGDTYNSIEGLIGSAFNDSLRGDGQANTLIGGAGNDFLRGRGGADVLDGGVGSDTADYFTAPDLGGGIGVTVDLANTNNNTGEAVGDTFVSIENLRGSAFNDTLRGNSASNALDGHAGADTLDGGGGNDEVRYDLDFGNGGTGGVTVNLATGIATDGFGNTDRLVSIELIRGTSQADTLTGGNAASFGFEAYRGLAGNDIITGGDGFDEVRYDLDALNGGVAGVTVNLATGQATDGFGNTDTLSGIQSVRGTASNDTFVGSDALGFFGESFQGLGGNDNITGALGFDEARYDQDAAFGGLAGVTVNLGSGTATDGFGNTDSLSGIEGARGTHQIDSLIGDAGFFNFFAGLGGDDIINGGGGDDEARYDFDAGFGGTAGVTVNLGAGTAADGFGSHDTLISIERTRGTLQADNLTGSDANNQLMGLGGNDQLIGGLGFDEVRYDADFNSGGTAGVNVNLAAGTAIDGFGNTDTLSGFEAVRGTRFADSFLGNAEDNTFFGLAGDDTLNGGDGKDWAAYSDDIFNRDETEVLSAISVNLGAGTATDSYGGHDTLINMENAAGGTLGDSLIGSAGDNIFRGLAGNDSIDGLAGVDTVDYSTDRRYGDATFMNGSAGVTVNLATGTATDGFGNTDALSNIENAIGTGFADTLIGDGGNNTLRGGAGGDSLIGGLGGDRLDGGDAFGVSTHGGSVLRLYQATLDRLPDVSGFNHWVSQLDGGTPLSSITTGFINSPEFQQTYGSLDNSQFVTLLYNNVLDRAPDASGLAFWANTLNGGASRESVVNGFSESPEFQVNTEFAALAFATTQLNGLDFGQVFRVYQATLDRAPDASGFEFWTDALAGDVSLESMTTGFVNSPEFQQTYGSLNNSQFVTLLYNNVLDRAPDAGGLAFWGSVLGGGATRASVVLGFSESPEFITNTDAALKSFVQTGVPNWADVLTGGGGDDQMVGGRGSDAFVFNASDAGADHVYGLEVWDKLQLTGFGYATDADALAHMSQLGEDVIFNDQGVSITFHNTSLATLDQVWLVV